jgi:hypothetical protein
MVKLSAGLIGQICVSSDNKVATVRTLVHHACAVTGKRVGICDVWLVNLKVCTTELGFTVSRLIFL